MAGTIALGLWVGRRGRGLNDYLLGGRDLPWWALLGSIVATETSTATFLSIPGIAFAANGDLRFLQLTFGYLAGRLIVALVFLPHYFRGELYTAYELLERRFSPGVRKAASMLFLVARNLGDGLRLFLTAIALEKAVGLPLEWSVVAMGAATMLYTVVGGMRAVVWSDCVQLVIYVTGGAVALAMIVQALPGGGEHLLAFARSHDKLRLFDFTFDLTLEYTFWSGLVGGAFLTLGTHGTDQMMVQRYLCARRPRDAALAVTLSGAVVMVQFALFLVVGIALAAFYASFPPSTPFRRGDSVFATFIVTELPPGLVGLTLAAVFAAAMSTLSSSLNSSAASAANDLYAPWCRERPSPERLVKVSKRLTLGFGGVQIAVGIAAVSLSQSVVEDALAIAGFAFGILLGAYFLGLWTVRTGPRAVLAGMLTGAAVLTWIRFGTEVKWPWYAAIGAPTTFLAGYLASFVWPELLQRHSLQANAFRSMESSE
ncbi:MAG: sodium:solute symporter [Planctomycetes bacterium]|nr:sodium:solute symporter [Planctomycetota bacterium]